MLYRILTWLQDRPAATNPPLQVKLHELLNQPCEVRVALGIFVQLVQVPRLVLAQPILYCPVPQVLHSVTLHVLLKKPCVE
jgi:hypothetical protein